MLMPKTPMHKDHLAAWAEHKIRLSWKLLAVKAVAIAHAMNKLPHHQFGLHALGPDAAHVPTAPIFRNFISHN